MSLAADPQKTFSCSLPSDRHLPPEKQPKFTFRYMTCRQWSEFLEMREQVKEAETDEKLINIILPIIKKHLVGWKNVKMVGDNNVKFHLDKLEEVLGKDDLYELMIIQSAQGLTIDDKKKLESPLPSDTDNSAQNV